MTGYVYALFGKYPSQLNKKELEFLEKVHQAKTLAEVAALKLPQEDKE